MVYETLIINTVFLRIANLKNIFSFVKVIFYIFPIFFNILPQSPFMALP